MTAVNVVGAHVVVAEAVDVEGEGVITGVGAAATDVNCEVVGAALEYY